MLSMTFADTFDVTSTLTSQTMQLLLWAARPLCQSQEVQPLQQHTVSSFQHILRRLTIALLCSLPAEHPRCVRLQPGVQEGALKKRLITLLDTCQPDQQYSGDGCVHSQLLLSTKNTVCLHLPLSRCEACARYSYVFYGTALRPLTGHRLAALLPPTRNHDLVQLSQQP